MKQAARLGARAGLLALMLLPAACTPPAPPTASNSAQEAQGAVRISIPGPDHQITAGTLPAPEIDGVPVTPGTWVRDSGKDGDAALFTDARGTTLFAVRCQRSRRALLFVRSVPATPGAMMKIVTATGATSYAAAPRRFAPGAMAVVPVGDGFVATSLAQVSGRIGIVMAGSETLVMAATPMVGSVIGDCAARQSVGDRAQSS